MCLRVFEDAVRRKELNQSLDIIDGLVESNVHTEEVERFDPTPGKQPRQRQQQPTTSVPTGVGSDIAKQIKRRKRY